jgi:hypothetical protein
LDAEGAAMEPVWRLFVDEVGHANMKASYHHNERYLSLTGVIMPIEYERNQFRDALDGLKVEIFGIKDIVLHRTEIVYRRPPFDCLNDDELRAKFDAGVLTIVREGRYRVITVVIDKLEHKRRYAVWQAHPYHYCLENLLERYVLWLQGASSCGDVMAESRGKKDNKKLSKSYARLYEHGSHFVGHRTFQHRLTTRELKIRPKSANVPGLQLADLIANPSMKSLVCEKTGEK